MTSGKTQAFATREFFERIASAVVLGTVVLGALVLGGWPFALIWIAAGVVGASEWFTITRTSPVLALTLVNAAAIAATCAAILLDAPAWAVLGIAVLAAGALAGLARGGAAARLNAVIGYAGGAIVALVPALLREDPGIGIVGPAWMFAVVWSTDIIAYFTGRTIGGPKLMPRVSPKKTWSGALGGLAAGTLAGVAVVLVARGSGVAALPLWLVALASAAASVISQAGDLFESSLKRRYGVKDSGRSIPGHGGVMDRLDGFFAVSLLVGLYLLVHAILARTALPA
ncbi:phosphatidate cytidylyltransferase [Methylobacterium brachythecii]|uniref:Phosphatidate cytidylyltransferase n=1 Tax=Methylobacterium brachythecii TaxID=1176177 RepID=A0A7W6F5N9_9HYPH|nr:phosphatidate cytidylyltransferase [Methylobacterium brachythecii]MBB3901565.1 phosphatidate cytidylyltransferase [Methylobacterium brachythecii]GLS43135.1 phosphatidate cytidylyltransferase [Methylobacterium brachythecii]